MEKVDWEKPTNREYPGRRSGLPQAWVEHDDWPDSARFQAWNIFAAFLRRVVVHLDYP
jgi:hypothetical protein